jgi:26S proteasome regulatory subunit T5
MSGVPMTDVKSNAREDFVRAETLKLEALTNEEITQKTKMLDTNLKAMRADITQQSTIKADLEIKLKDSTERCKKNKQLPYLVSTVSEILDISPDDDEEDQANQDIKQNQGKAVIINTTTRQTVFLPVIGMVPLNELHPGELVGVNKDSFIIYEKLPPEYLDY